MAEAVTSSVEAELQEVGRELHGALPSAARHPIRALDARAMQATSRDRELRAALFRLVDVTPTCRSLDDLARHLSEYLADVEEPPPADATDTLAGLWRRGIASTLDLLGEATVTEREADRYAERCADALDTLSAAARRWPDRPRLESDSTGTLARVNLSVKVTALTPLI